MRRKRRPGADSAMLTLEERGESLVITRLPVEDMALLSLAAPLDEGLRRVIERLLQGGRVGLVQAGIEYKQYKKTAPLGVYQKFVGMERQLREMGIYVIRTGH